MAFFNAASHELKTPVTILKGQLSGMLDGVGVYQDRDKYLLRSLQVTGRMENLVGEMLAHLPDGDRVCGCQAEERVDLSALIERQLTLDAGLLEQRDQRLVSTLTPGGHRHRRPVSPRQGRGEPALQPQPSTPRRGQRSGCGAACIGGPPGPDGGEHWDSYQRGCPAPSL